MRKTILSFSISFLFVYCAGAQSPAPDKLKVMEYLQNQQFDEIISYLTPAIAHDSANLQWLGFLGYASYMNDNIAEAKKIYQQMIGIDSNNIAANQYLAIINNNSHPALAQVFTRRLVSLQPGKAVYYRNMADLFKKLNQRDSALFYYSHAYAMAPNDYKNAIGLSDIMIEKKNFAIADSILDAGLARDSLNIVYLKLRIRSAYEAKDFTKAILPGERLVQLADISLNPLTQLALAYYNLKMYTDCIRVCEYMLSNDLDIESIYYYEAKSFAKLKNFSRSNELLQVCLIKAISRTAELYYYNLGDNYEAMNQFTTAVKQYDSAYYLFKSPLMKYYTGRIYESTLKNEKFARKYYLQYLKFASPQSADEKKAYEYIRSKYGIRSKRKR